MEDYEAHEQEFFAKLEESEFSRSSMLRRSAAAAFGLTILGGSPSLAWAARRAGRGAAAEGHQGRTWRLSSPRRRRKAIST